MREAVLFVHIASAILLAGDLVFGTAWLAGSLRAPGGPALARYVQRSLRSSGRRIALPAMLVLFLSGLYLVHLDHLSFHRDLWVSVSLLLFLVLSGLWHGVLIPVRKKMERAAESAGTADALGEDYPKLARAWINASGAILFLTAAILVLMVSKPKL